MQRHEEQPEEERSGRRDWGDRDELYDRLPARQQRLLALVAEGHSDQKLAEIMGDPIDRVRSEVRSLLAELGFETRTQAVLYVIDRSLRRAGSG